MKRRERIGGREREVNIKKVDEEGGECTPFNTGEMRIE